MANFLYVLGLPEGPVKVGFTSDPYARWQSIRIASPIDVRMFRCYETNSYPEPLERSVHALLKEKRVNGEWFNVSGDEATRALLDAANAAGIVLTETAAKRRRRPSDPVLGGTGKKRGRPPTYSIPTMVRLPPDVSEALDTYAADHNESRPKAIVRALRTFLTKPQSP